MTELAESADPNQSLAGSPPEDAHQQDRPGEEKEAMNEGGKSGKGRKGRRKQRIFLPGGHDIRLTVQVNLGMLCDFP